MGRQFSDNVESPSEHFCFTRATAYNTWCGNQPTRSNSVAATYTPTGRTQLSDSASCDPSWILYGDSCYFFNTQNLYWYRANDVCISAGASLSSVHSEAENSFLHFLTGGVSTWIGLVDIDHNSNYVEDHRWTDRSEVNYRNWNDTKAADQPRPPGEWFDWDGNDPAPSVCKRRARSDAAGIRAMIASEVLSIDLPQAAPQPIGSALNEIIDHNQGYIGLLVGLVWGLFRSLMSG